MRSYRKEETRKHTRKDIRASSSRFIDATHALEHPAPASRRERVAQ
jgi:hypothetical protein